MNKLAANVHRVSNPNFYYEKRREQGQLLLHFGRSSRNPARCQENGTFSHLGTRKGDGRSQSFHLGDRHRGLFCESFPFGCAAQMKTVTVHCDRIYQKCGVGLPIRNWEIRYAAESHLKERLLQTHDIEPQVQCFSTALRPCLSEHALRQAIETQPKNTKYHSLNGVAYAALPASAHLPCEIY